MTKEKLKLSVAVYSAEEHVKTFLGAPLEEAFTEVHLIQARLDKDTAKLAQGYDACCLFVNDCADKEVVKVLADGGVKFIAMYCAGFDRVDVEAANRLGLRVVRVPTYSPKSVAEHALALMFDVARNLHMAHLKMLVHNYTASGLVGSQLSGKTFGVVGTGNIGVEFIRLLKGFGGRVLAYDVVESQDAKEAGATYEDLETVLRESDFVSLHVPLLPATFHIINSERLALMKPNAILVNVSRGGLIDTAALIRAVEDGKLGGVAMDVYEGEGNLFFNDFSKYNAHDRMKSWDSQFHRLQALPHVIVTPHIAFLTNEALANIAATTVENLQACARGDELVNEVKP